jgi:enterochelin esterase-like enzyme
MLSQRGRWSVSVTLGIAVVGAVLSARRDEAPKLRPAKRVQAEIAAHAEHRYAVPLAARDCALGTLSGSDGLALTVHEAGSDRVLRRFALGNAPQHFGFCGEAAGNYELAVRAAAAAGGYALSLDVVLARPAAVAAAAPPADVLMSPRLRALSATKPTPDQLAQLWSEVVRDGSPLIEPGDDDTSWVTFLYRGEGPERSVALSWQLLADSALARLPGTNLWWKSVQLPNETRLSYQLVIDPPAVGEADEALLERAQAAVSRADPLNESLMLPELQLDVYAQLSVVQLPAAAPERWLDPALKSPPGRLVQHTATSTQLGHSHALTMYVPPGYDAAQLHDLPLLIFFDGGSYLRDENTPRLLDALIGARAIRPLLALFVHDDDPSQRADELPCNPRFAAFVAEELLPFARAHYRVTSDAAHIGLAGASFGGLASSFIALTYPERFGKVLSQSGSFWWSFAPDSPHFDGVDEAGWLRRRFAERPPSHTQFYLSAGMFEGSPEGNGVLEETRRQRDALRALGYTVAYQEFAGGHDHLAWRATLPDALIALYAP